MWKSACACAMKGSRCAGDDRTYVRRWGGRRGGRKGRSERKVRRRNPHHRTGACGEASDGARPQACGQTAATAASSERVACPAGCAGTAGAGYSPGSSSARVRRRLRARRLRRRALRRSRSRPRPELSLGVGVRRLGLARPRPLRLGLGGGRVELLLGRQLAALGHDEQPQLGGHVAEHLDRHRVAADPLDRADVELAAVDPDLQVLPELVGDVRRGDRAEQRPGRAGLDVEAELRRLEPLRDRARLVGRLRLVPRPLRVALLELAHEPGRRELGEPAREQVVARVAARDVHHLAAQAEALDVLPEDDLHLARSTAPRGRHGRRGRGGRRPRGRRGPRPRTAAVPSRAPA